MTDSYADAETQQNVDSSQIDFLSRIQTSHESRPLGVILYGEPGSGKSSLAAEFSNPLFVVGDTDRGVETLKSFNLVSPDLPILKVSDHYELLSFLEQLIDTDNLPYKYLVLDQFSVFQHYLFDYVCNEEFNGDWSQAGFMNYNQGYDRAPSYLVEVLDLLDQIRDKGIGVVIVAHSVVRPFHHPVLGSYDRYSLDAHHKLEKELNKWADTILFLDYETDTVDPVKGKQGHTRAKGGKVRKLHVEQEAAFNAKNRFGLKGSILGGSTAKDLYKAFHAAMVKAKKSSSSATKS